MCQGPCKSNQNCVACDSCDTWFHVKCMNMPLVVFHGIKNTSWSCFTCGIPNFSTTLFETTHYSDSLATSIATENTYSVLSPSLDAVRSPESTSTDSLSSLDSPIGSPKHSSSPLRSGAQPNSSCGGSSLRVLSLNFQIMRAKSTPFWLLLEEANPDAIIGSETWLHQGFHENEVLPQGYHMVARKDRQTDHHGRVMIAARDNINGTEISMQSRTELAAASFDCPGKAPIAVGALYRPPSSDQAYMEALCSSIKELNNSDPKATVWIAGDINLPDINWQTSTITGSNNPVIINQLLLDL